MDQRVLQKIGKYEIVSELAQGGVGVVYKARDPFIGRMVALKTITPELVSDPEILKRFYREVQSAGMLQHRNIVTIYDLGEADGRPYIAMEFVEGESLQAIINQRAQIPLAVKLKLVQQVCEGLGHAHKHGVVHRDVKPANIMVTHDGIVKMVDFGIAHLETTSLTKTGRFLGALYYASPEKINDGRVDSRSDLWSATAVFYEFIAYKRPFEGSNIAAIIAKVLTADPEPLSRCCPGVPADLDPVISKGLAKNMEDRYASLDELLNDLLPVASRLQQSFVGELMGEARDLWGKGDISGAQEKVRAVLILDHTHGEANRLYSEITSTLQHQAAPAKTQNPEPGQALAEQNRGREVREALISGQRAMKQGDLTGAEQQLHRVLQLDQSNAQAAEFLTEIKQDRQGRERDFHVKEALWQADKLVAAGNLQEAQDQLLALQREFPASGEVRLKLEALDRLVRAGKFVQEGRSALNQGEYGEAVRALTAALELNPQDKEALGLKDRALQERDRLRLVREALSAGQRAVRDGDSNTAALEFKKAVQLDPTNAQAASLMGQVRQTQAAQEREAKFREALQKADNLVAEKKFEEAQYALLSLQQEFPGSAEINQKLSALDQQLKLHLLVTDGEQAFNQGEFGEAVRILTEAQALVPNDERIRGLKVRAVQERDRLRQVRELIAAGQRALRQGLADVAEQQYQRALQLDPANSQASNLLTQLQTGRQAQEREQVLKAGLSLAESLIVGKKFDEAQRQLEDLQRAYPGAESLRPLFQILNQRKAEAVAIPAPPPPAPRPVMEGPPVRPAPPSDYTKSMELAEELRLNLLKLQGLGAARPAKRPASATQTSVAGPQSSGRGQVPASPAAQPPGQASDVTLLMGSSFNAHAAPSGNEAPKVGSTPAESKASGVVGDPVGATPTVTLTSPGDSQPWNGPIQNGQIVPDSLVEGGLKPVNLAVPPVPNAPAKAEVIFIISIDPSGNVAPIRKVVDVHGLGSHVMAAAKLWKFNPPTAKGNPVSTTLQARVVF